MVVRIGDLELQASRLHPLYRKDQHGSFGHRLQNSCSPPSEYPAHHGGIWIVHVDPSRQFGLFGVVVVEGLMNRLCAHACCQQQKTKRKPYRSK